MESEPDYKFEIVLIGDSGVGKTSILRRYTTEEFSLHFDTTIGVDYRTKTLKIGSSMVQVHY